MNTSVTRRVAVAGMAFLFTSNAALAAQRTFVATTGSDAHPCSLAQPCRGFAAALTHTDAGGEIVVLDSGGYGRVTINKSATIIAPAGVHAGISVFAGTNGIDIPAGGIKVVLRGLSISGQGGTDGIYVSGDNELTIEGCDIGGMAGSGIHLDGVAGTVQIRDTVVHDNGGNGIMLFGALSAALDRVQIERNTASGLYLIDGPKVEAKDSRSMRNNRGIEVTSTSASAMLAADGLQIASNNHEGVKATIGAFNLTLMLVRSNVGYNPGGGVVLQATGSATGNALLSDSEFTGNGTGVTIDNGTSGGTAKALVVRNDFNDGIAVNVNNGSSYQSGGGNVLGPAVSGYAFRAARFRSRRDTDAQRVSIDVYVNVM